MKKKFWETGFGKFISKAGKSIPEVLTIGSKALTGNFPGAIQEVGELLKNKSSESEENEYLMIEFEKFKMGFQKELYELEIKDRDSARKREVSLLNAGGSDWMMNVTGIIGLLSFILIVCSVIWIPSVKNNELFIHLMGMVEGVVIGNIFAYYYGSSKT